MPIRMPAAKLGTIASAIVINATFGAGGSSEIVLYWTTSSPRIENGINLLREVNYHCGKQTPFIVMTAHGNDGPHQGVDCIRMGAADYIPKPFPIRRFQTANRPERTPALGTGRTETGHQTPGPTPDGPLRMLYRDSQTRSDVVEVRRTCPICRLGTSWSLYILLDKRRCPIGRKLVQLHIGRMTSRSRVSALHLKFLAIAGFPRQPFPWPTDGRFLKS